MAGDFTPFLSTLKSSLQASASAPAASPEFRPAALPSTAPRPASGHTTHLHKEVKIELERAGDRISLIRIHCRCGEVIELDCE